MVIDLNKITTVGELHKALAESGITVAQQCIVLTLKGTHGIFKAIDLLRKFIDENEKGKE
jgi:arginine repressor